MIMNTDNSILAHQPKQRNVALDLIRVIAIFLVLFQHSSEFYYIGPNLSLTNYSDTHLIGWMNSLPRICIGLFVMISGYFLLPMKTGARAFFHRRFTRILWPWVFWCVAFAVYYVFYRGDSSQQCLVNILNIPVNWGVQVGHLWYIYMLIGIYLIIPVLSPWAQTCSKRAMQMFLLLWAATTLLPYIHLVTPEVWGECPWNHTPSLYYFTGFVGYLVLGSYIRRFGPCRKGIAVAILLVGYVATAVIFNSRITSVSNVVELEVPWDFCSLNVAMMAYGMFSLLSQWHVKNSGWLPRLITSISACSFGMYLSHIMLLNAAHDILEGLSQSVALMIPLIAVSTFVTTYIAVWLLSYLPAAKYWLGVEHR